jgi:hypothetical protein
MYNDDKLAAIAAALLLVSAVAVAWWWLPQKWNVCQGLYDNVPAQVFCFSSK